MVARARARREGCGSWRTPAAGWNAGPLKHAGERFTTTEDRLGELRALLDEACTGRDQARRERSRAARRTSGPAPRLPGFSAR